MTWIASRRDCVLVRVFVVLLRRSIAPFEDAMAVGTSRVHATPEAFGLAGQSEVSEEVLRLRFEEGDQMQCLVLRSADRRYEALRGTVSYFGAWTSSVGQLQSVDERSHLGCPYSYPSQVLLRDVAKLMYVKKKTWRCSVEGVVEASRSFVGSGQGKEDTSYPRRPASLLNAVTEHALGSECEAAVALAIDAGAFVVAVVDAAAVAAFTASRGSSCCSLGTCA